MSEMMPSELNGIYDNRHIERQFVDRFRPSHDMLLRKVLIQSANEAMSVAWSLDQELSDIKTDGSTPFLLAHFAPEEGLADAGFEARSTVVLALQAEQGSDIPNTDVLFIVIPVTKEWKHIKNEVPPQASEAYFLEVTGPIGQRSVHYRFVSPQGVYDYQPLERSDADIERALYSFLDDPESYSARQIEPGYVDRINAKLEQMVPVPHGEIPIGHSIIDYTTEYFRQIDAA